MYRETIFILVLRTFRQFQQAPTIKELRPAAVLRVPAKTVAAQEGA